MNFFSTYDNICEVTNGSVTITAKYIIKTNPLYFIKNRTNIKRIKRYFYDYLIDAAYKYDNSNINCSILNIIQKDVKEPFVQDCKNLHIECIDVELVRLKLY